MNFGKQLKEGLITQNPVLVQVLGYVLHHGHHHLVL